MPDFAAVTAKVIRQGPFFTTNEHQFTRMTGDAYSRFHLFLSAFPAKLGHSCPLVLIRGEKKSTPLKQERRRLGHSPFVVKSKCKLWCCRF
jgi:hypothetical protein